MSTCSPSDFLAGDERAPSAEEGTSFEISESVSAIESCLRHFLKVSLSSLPLPVVSYLYISCSRLVSAERVLASLRKMVSLSLSAAKEYSFSMNLLLAT